MAETVISWAPRGAWAGVASPGSFGAQGTAGVAAALLDGFGLASLIAAPDAEPALSRAIETRLGVSLPQIPRIVSGGPSDLIWAGPEHWLLRTATQDDLPALLAELAPHAAVSDQSDARAALRLSGPRVRDVLAKGVMLDLHPAAFAAGDAASTIIAHVGVQLWRLPDGPDGPVFEIMVPRSMAGSFWSWLVASASEFGCRVAPGRG
jgi:sarcosine oxidase subunit gamma